ncbi:MAG: hypothetical protein IJ418_09240 [Clostridia bacterium]|nr:hypothetical protein [Clostridia bacterium]
MSSEFAIKVLKDIAEAAEAASDPEAQAAFEEEMRKQEERRRQIDDLCLQSMEAMSAGMELIQKILAENVLTNEDILSLTGNLAKLGSAMAQMRLNMGYAGWAGMGCA